MPFADIGHVCLCHELHGLVCVGGGMVVPRSAQWTLARSGQSSTPWSEYSQNDSEMPLGQVSGYTLSLTLFLPREITDQVTI